MKFMGKCLFIFIIAYMAAEYKMKTAFENLTQLPIFLKIIFTAGRRKLIDICKIVV